MFSVCGRFRQPTLPRPRQPTKQYPKHKTIRVSFIRGSLPAIQKILQNPLAMLR